MATPVYQQIANRLVTLIHEGVIRPGSPLPSSREMAAVLAVHRKTIIAAYEELSAQNWIITILRKGVSVSKDLPEIKPRSFKANVKNAGYAEHAGFPFSKLVIHSTSMSKAGDHRF